MMLIAVNLLINSDILYSEAEFKIRISGSNIPCIFLPVN
jgi:hypothetical protein